MSYASEVLADSPLVYWKLDETSAASVGTADTIGGGYWSVGPGTTPARPAVCADGGASMAPSGIYPVATILGVPSGLAGASCSVDFWVNIPAANAHGAFVQLGASGANGWTVGIGSGTIESLGHELIFLHENVAWKPTGYTLTAGVHHIAVTRTAANLFTAYVDGVSRYAATFAPATATSFTGVGGANHAARHLSANVDIDNVAFYPSVLTSGQVTTHAATTAGYAAVVAADGAGVYLPLDDGTVNKVLDSSGNARHAIHQYLPTVNQTSLLGDGSGKSVLYTGQPTYSHIDAASWMNITTISVEARVKPGSTSASQPIVSRWPAGGGGTSWHLWFNSGKLQAQIAGGTITGATTVTAGVTYTVGMSYDGTTAKLYLNGTVDATLAITGPLPAVGYIEIARVAGDTGGFWGVHVIDEVSIMGTVIGDARFAARHAAAVLLAPITGTPPVATVTVSALPVSASFAYATIPVATVSVSAPAPTVPTVMPVAVVSVAALIPVVNIGVPTDPATLNPGTARTRYGVDLRVQLALGRQEGRGVWDVGVWDSAYWGQADTELGDWLDVTCDVEDPFRLTAGASDAEGVVTRWEAATCYFTLWGATWDPWAGPYAGIVGPGVGVRVLWRPTFSHDSAPWAFAFRGSVAADGWEWKPSPTHDSVRVSAVDLTEILVAYEAVEGTLTGDGDIASARVARILDIAEWPDDADHRDILTGGVENQPTNLGGVAWEQLLIAADTDLGILWFNRAGVLCYRPTGRTGENVRDAGALSVCPKPGAHQMVTMGGAQPTDVKNIVTIGRADIPTDPVTDAPPPTTARNEGSIARYRARRYERTDLTHSDDSWSAVVAGAIVGTAAFPAAAPRDVTLDSRMRDPMVPRLLLSVEPDMTFDVYDRIDQLWREAVTGWQVTVGIGHIEGTIVLNDVTRWAAGHWDEAIWDTDHWGFISPAERRRRNGDRRA